MSDGEEYEQDDVINDLPSNRWAGNILYQCIKKITSGGQCEEYGVFLARMVHVADGHTERLVTLKLVADSYVNESEKRKTHLRREIEILNSLRTY
jgi:hypothetical protein